MGSKCIFCNTKVVFRIKGSLVNLILNVNRRMFSYAWLFEFNFPTNMSSFGSKPSYNLKRPLDACFCAFWNGI